VTKDANVALKARALGLESEDYRNDQVDAKDMGQSDGCETVAVAEHELQAFASLHRLDVMGREPALVPNQYVLLRTPGGHTMPARATGTGDVVVLRFPQTICPASTPVRPRNLEQQFLCDALFNPDIKIVTVRGQAGTGKTLITMAAALAQATGPNARYDRVTISRPVITVGKDIGFLPGSMIEKLSPFLQCYYDALEFLFNQKRTLQPQFVDKKQSGRKHRHGCAGLPEAPALRAQSSQGPSAKPYDGLLKAGILQIEGLCFIRGRSIPNTVMIVDECQNLTRTEIRTIVTRMSEGSKLILLGDESQIDQPFIDARSNGLVHTAVKFRGQMIAAQINLTRCERSELAELGANLL
jgi:PhoH-like ATPase